MKIKRPKNVDRASFRYGIQIAAEVAADYDRYSSHPYLVSDCILGKLNVLKGKPKKNAYALDRISVMERKVASCEATTRFIAGMQKRTKAKS